MEEEVQMPVDQGVEEASINQVRNRTHCQLQKQGHEADEQFQTQKAKRMRLTDPVEDEISSLQPMTRGVVEMWERKAPGRKESGQLKMMARGEVDQ